MEPSLAAAPLRVVVPFYGMWRKHRTAPVQGWHFHVDRSDIAVNDMRECNVSIRSLGSVDVFEVHTRIWGDASVLFETDHVIPKMTCESDPISLTLHFPVGPMPDAPWVGVTWVDATRRRVAENAARVNVLTDEYQRWKWRTIRNIFRGPKGRPKGKWVTIGNQRERKRYFVPRWEGEDLTVQPSSVPPYDVW